ncbi:ATP-binding protein [Streptomyces sp. NPDC058625]|uniref:ATP-binding protein n=1 Tax=Streptomyces sp. NPDC058625 TaxID=3346564 RepID=UPI0036653B81
MRREDSSQDGYSIDSPDSGVEPLARAPQFTIRLSSTGRGVRPVRRPTGQQLAGWGVPYDSGTSRAVALVTAEPASNAVAHGRLPGRDFRLTLLLLPEHDAVRVEVTDTRPELLPHLVAAPTRPDAESGRGLLLVEAYADRWGCSVREAYTETVWAKVPLRAGHAPVRAPGRSE